MAKVPYIGVDGVARKCKSLHIGVDGVARKVKSAYIGVDGVARQFYCSEPRAVFLTFISPNVFSIKTADTSKHWDGVLEYSTDTINWKEWDGSEITAASGDDGYALYFSGTGNTIITGGGKAASKKWSITGTNVQCIGNIETILDYEIVNSGEHPTMKAYCYSNMFDGCTSLTKAPSLPATTLKDYCYYYMFNGCTSLTEPPSLPATTLKTYCYCDMFSGCTSLTKAPSLPATTLADSCYRSMFVGCTSLTTAQSLPATTLADSCYQSMFQGCTGLKQAPSLPATTLERDGYGYMFMGCTSLVAIPSLQADWIPTNCYYGMFKGCEKIKLSTTKTGEYTTEYRIPPSGTAGNTQGALNSMFTDTGGTFTGTPSVNTTYYLSSSNAIV